jgi:hypothetical protein
MVTDTERNRSVDVAERRSVEGRAIGAGAVRSDTERATERLTERESAGAWTIGRTQTSGAVRGRRYSPNDVRSGRSSVGRVVHTGAWSARHSEDQSGDRYISKLCGRRRKYIVTLCNYPTGTVTSGERPAGMVLASNLWLPVSLPMVSCESTVSEPGGGGSAVGGRERENPIPSPKIFLRPRWGKRRPIPNR